jgi:multiple sugar transport system ATP-binding protein
MKKVVLKNVTKKFDDVVAVDCFNLEIEDRQFIVLVGPSGCGKTTTLRMVAGLEEVTEGEIYIKEKLVNDLPPKSRDIAMVFQSYALYPHMKVYDNIGFGLKMRKVPQAERDAQIRKAADILSISNLLDRKPRQLSGGQRQRVALGRAIVRQPEVFLFDEPLSNLDAKLRVQMRTELKKLHERLQATVIYVTHDQVEAMTMGDLIVVMRDGVIQQVGPPLELYNRPSNRFVASFIGSPTMNLIDCEVKEENGQLRIDTGGFSIAVDSAIKENIRNAGGRKFILGIRPEDISEKGANGNVVANGRTITANVNVIEILGRELMLDLTSGSHTLTALVSIESNPQLHQDMELIINLDKIHLFKMDSGEAITSPVGATYVCNAR